MDFECFEPFLIIDKQSSFLPSKKIHSITVSILLFSLIKLDLEMVLCLLTLLRLVHGPRADFRCRGVIWPESSPHVFLLPKTLNLKKKSGGHLSVVAFGSERPLSENSYTF